MKPLITWSKLAWLELLLTEDEIDAGEIEEAPQPEVVKVEVVPEQEAEQLDFRDVLKSKV